MLGIEVVRNLVLYFSYKLGKSELDVLEYLSVFPINTKRMSLLNIDESFLPNRDDLIYTFKEGQNLLGNKVFLEDKIAKELYSKFLSEYHKVLKKKEREEKGSIYFYEPLTSFILRIKKAIKNRLERIVPDGFSFEEKPFMSYLCNLGYIEKKRKLFFNGLDSYYYSTTEKGREKGFFGDKNIMIISRCADFLKSVIEDYFIYSYGINRLNLYRSNPQKDFVVKQDDPFWRFILEIAKRKFLIIEHNGAFFSKRGLVIEKGFSELFFDENGIYSLKNNFFTIVGYTNVVTNKALSDNRIGLFSRNNIKSREPLTMNDISFWKNVVGLENIIAFVSNKEIGDWYLKKGIKTYFVSKESGYHPEAKIEENIILPSTKRFKKRTQINKGFTGNKNKKSLKTELSIVDVEKDFATNIPKSDYFKKRSKESFKKEALPGLCILQIKIIMNR